MTNAQLATARLNDIVFDGRNQGYGAYQLRALYQRHVTRALAIAVAICALLLVFPLLARLLEGPPAAAPRTVLDEGHILMAPPLAPDVVTPPPPAAVQPPPPQRPTVQDLVPVVVKEADATDKSVVPERNKLFDENTGPKAIAGDPDAGPEVPLDLPVGKGETVTADVVPAAPYTYVEQMPELPGGGGQLAIVTAIQRAVKYPGLALRHGVEGKIFVSFTVNPKGEVVDAKIVKGLGSGLDEETLRAINTLPRFIPGKQNGREVSVSFTVPVTFRIQ